MRGEMNIDFAGRNLHRHRRRHGFGRAIAHAFAQRAPTVWACDVSADGLAETARRRGGDLHARTVDVGDRKRCGRSSRRRGGGVDILVNNAGGV